MTVDEWGIRKMTNEELVKVLQNPLTCDDALRVAKSEALARLIKMMPKGGMK